MNALRALRHSNFAWFVGGQVLAIAGYWLQNVALAWYVYRTTGSATLLGAVGFAASVPALLLAPVAGLWADRVDRHRAMIAVQVLEMLHAVALASLAFAGLLTVPAIIVLSVFLGALVAIELPLRNAYLLELLGNRSELPDAVAVLSLTANAGRVAGPALAGWFIAWFSEAACFAIYAATYVTVLVSFAFIRPRRASPNGRPAPMLTGLHDGLRYAWARLPIRTLLFTLAVLALAAMPYTTLAPAIVRQVLNGDAEGLGLLMSAAGGGALAAALPLTFRREIGRLPGRVVLAVAIAGCALCGMGYSRSIALSAVLMAAVGFCLLTATVSVNMVLQTIVDDDKRGRILSLHTTALLGVAPFGALAAGFIADRIGAPLTLAAGGAICLAAAAALSRIVGRVAREVRAAAGG